MKNLPDHNLYIALLHYPVIDKNSNIIASAITNLDLHDIARAAKTYGVTTFYVITPMKDQIELAEKIISHWKKGAGAAYNPDRGEALDIICIKETLEQAVEHIRLNGNGSPKTVATSAGTKSKKMITCETLKNMLNSGLPHLLLFGTAWGLADEVISESDYLLGPIRGKSGYNHLSVRSAASIILDRISERAG